MISICIPIYNFDVKQLVSALKREIDAFDLDAELVFIDDASNKKYKIVNRETCVGLTYHELESNVGRAKIRNLFLNFAKGDYFLFLDCDSLLATDRFVSTYLQAIKPSSDVICGGRVYPKEKPKKSNCLSWKYGIAAESKSVEQRTKFQFDSFMTNNFLIKRSIFEQIQFNESIRDYGHEDTLFGFDLFQAKKNIHHIENPVLNGHIETNAEFLRKTNVALENLVFILGLVKNDTQFIASNKLLRFYFKWEKKGLLWLFRLFFPLNNMIFRLSLSIGFVSILAFSVYKLSVFDKSWRHNRI
jgi:glycosyltransferase involved in cell wall biosynthesis